MDLTWPAEHSVTELCKHDEAARLTRGLLAGPLPTPYTVLLSLFSPTHQNVFLCLGCKMISLTNMVPTLLEQVRRTIKSVAAAKLEECFLGEVQGTVDGRILQALDLLQEGQKGLSKRSDIWVDF